MMRIRELYRPYRLAWSRTGGSQPSDRGSNPLGATILLRSGVTIMDNYDELRRTVS